MKKNGATILHIGGDQIIRTKDIVGIFDLDNCTLSQKTKEYLARAQQAKNVWSVSQELPRTFVVCRDRGVETVYLTQISSRTLERRAAESDEKALFFGSP